MERRKILLGSGAAFVTVLAGCSSTETGEENPDESGSDDDSGHDDSGTDDTGDDHDDDDDDEDLPGVEGVKDLESDHLSVVDVHASPGALEVYVETDTTDSQKLHDELAYVAEDLSAAIVDRDRFKSEVETIELVLEHDGARVFAVFVDVEWLLDFLDDHITREELKNKVVDSKH